MRAAPRALPSRPRRARVEPSRESALRRPRSRHPVRLARASSALSDAPATSSARSERHSALPTAPSVPPDRVRWVDDVDGLRAATAAVRALCEASTSARAPACLGLDAEWRPGDNTPVALLQIATREEVFLVDLLATAPRSAGEALNGATDELLQAVLWSEGAYKLGFSFAYDIKRMKASYSHLKVWGQKSKNMVDVKQLAFATSRNKTQLRVGLAALTRQVIGCTLDKAEQRSDWAKRPLTANQIAYAAADGYSLCLIFDKCLEAVEDEGEIARVLQEVIELGEPLRGLPRQVKKVRVKAQKEAQKAAKRGGQGKPCQFARETPIEQATADVLSSLERVGSTLSGGRKGALDLLSPDVPIRTKNDGRNVDTWANAVSIFISVGKPQTKGPTSFWENDGELYMSWDGKAAGALDEDIARVRRSRSAEFTGQDVAEGAIGDNALLFIRRPPGQFVFCGRLEAVPESESSVSPVVTRLVDGERLRSSTTYHQLIGCRLAAPSS